MRGGGGGARRIFQGFKKSGFVSFKVFSLKRSTAGGLVLPFRVVSQNTFHRRYCVVLGLGYLLGIHFKICYEQPVLFKWETPPGDLLT